MKAMKIQVFVLIGLLLCSCDKHKDSPLPLLPLNVGNSWKYEYTLYYGETPYSQIDEIEIKYSNTIDGITGYSFEEYSEGSPVTLMNNDAEGNCNAYFFDNGSLIQSTLVYKKDAKKGDHWEYKVVVFPDEDDSEYNIEQYSMTCVAVDTLITTPAGNFNCIGFSYDYGEAGEGEKSDMTMVNYLSENVGIVKTVYYNQGIGLYSEGVLIDYHIK